MYGGKDICCRYYTLLMPFFSYFGNLHWWVCCASCSLLSYVLASKVILAKLDSILPLSQNKIIKKNPVMPYFFYNVI